MIAGVNGLGFLIRPYFKIWVIIFDTVFEGYIIKFIHYIVLRLLIAFIDIFFYDFICVWWKFGFQRQSWFEVKFRVMVLVIIILMLGLVIMIGIIIIVIIIIKCRFHEVWIDVLGPLALRL